MLGVLTDLLISLELGWPCPIVTGAAVILLIYFSKEGFGWYRKSQPASLNRFLVGIALSCVGFGFLLLGWEFHHLAFFAGGGLAASLGVQVVIVEIVRAAKGSMGEKGMGKRPVEKSASKGTDNNLPDFRTTLNHRDERVFPGH